MNLNDLITKMRDLADSMVGMNGFVFEDLSRVNDGDSNEYPLLFVQPGASAIAKIDEPIELIDIEMWVLDQYLDNEQASTTLEQKWSDTHDLGVQYLREFKRLNAELGIGSGSTIAVLRGQLMHDDVLIGTKYTFQIRLTTNCDTGTFE